MLGPVVNLIIVYESESYFVRPNLYLKRIISMHCYDMYCTPINRYTKVQKMLTHAHTDSRPPRQPANRSRPQHRQTKTKHAHTLYTQSAVHSQYASPPGGESMYSILHLDVHIISCILPYIGQTKCRPVYFVVSTLEIERILFGFNIAVQSMQSCLRIYASLLVIVYGIFAPSYSSLSVFFDTIKYSVLQVCRLFSVHEYRAKMSVPGDDSQPSRPASVGEYLYCTYNSLVKYALLPILYSASLSRFTVLYPRYILYMCRYCYIYCNGSLSYGE
jgi:hypothetical protein